MKTCFCNFQYSSFKKVLLGAISIAPYCTKLLHPILEVAQGVDPIDQKTLFLIYLNMNCYD
jgi:hypothetical protein